MQKPNNTESAGLLKYPPRKDFLPTSRDEMDALGWDQADIIIFSGDAYVDHPSFGAASPTGAMTCAISGSSASHVFFSGFLPALWTQW